MPFGLVNSGATLAKGLREVLKNHENVGIYVDDIIVYNNTFEEHLKTIERVLQKLKEVSITLKTSKCMFGQTEIEFIGHLIKQLIFFLLFPFNVL